MDKYFWLYILRISYPELLLSRRLTLRLFTTISCFSLIEYKICLTYKCTWCTRLNARQTLCCQKTRISIMIEKFVETCQLAITNVRWFDYVLPNQNLLTVMLTNHLSFYRVFLIHLYCCNFAFCKTIIHIVCGFLMIQQRL